ncbi:MAG: hypothetical protein ACE37F_26075 [Nannocystaceae bacterium]|nr:hypothetical protein [bacterium]
MTEKDLNSSIMSAVGDEPASIKQVVAQVAKAPTVDASQARAAVERLVDSGKLQLNLDMRLEAAK